MSRLIESFRSLWTRNARYEPLGTPSISPSRSDNTTDATPPTLSDLYPPVSEAGIPDAPVKLDQFYSNIRRCKLVLGVALPFGMGVEVGCLVLKILAAQQREGNGEDDPAGWMLRSFVSDIGSLVLTLISLLVFLPQSLLPASSLLTRLHSHSLLLSTLFSLSLISLALLVLPPSLYIIATHNSPPPIIHSALFNTLSIARAIFVGLVFLASGSMRRGPKLFYPFPTGAQGFGISDMTPPSPSPSSTTTPTAPESDSEPSPEPNVLDIFSCSLFSFWFLSFISPLASKSFRNPQLVQQDLPFLPYERRTEFVEWDAKRRAAEREWERKEEEGLENGDQREWTPWRLITRLYSGMEWFMVGCCAIEACKSVIAFLPAYALHEIVETFQRDENGVTLNQKDKGYAMLMCGALFLGSAGEAVLTSFVCIRENVHIHNRVRMNMGKMMFAKILTARDSKASEANDNREDGSKQGRSQLVNLITLDLAKVSSISVKFENIADAIVDFTVGSYFLTKLFGWLPTFVGLAVLPLLTPISFYIAAISFRCDTVLAQARDVRASAVKEMLMSMKVIKLNAWEDHHRRKIARLRDKEMSLQRYRYTIGTAFNIVADAIPMLSLLVLFWVYVSWTKQVLEPSQAFVAFTVITRVRGAFNELPKTTEAILTALISLRRLCGYLNSDDQPANAQTKGKSDIVVKGTIKWPTLSQALDAAQPIKEFKLESLELTIPYGQLTCLFGNIGTGKSLLLLGLLGEAEVIGTVVAPHSVADDIPLTTASFDDRIFASETWLRDDMTCYAPQYPHTRHGTIRENILYGQPFWPKRYKEVLRQAALLPDLQLLEHGDLTEVGEGGVTLSGGQRARVSLARCIYSRARTVYLDDPLSAVDSHTASYIVDECFKGPKSLLKGRTVVLVSHQVSLVISAAKYVIALSDRGLPVKAGLASDFDSSLIQQLDDDTEEPEIHSPTSPKTPLKKVAEVKEASRKPAQTIYKDESKSQGVGTVGNSALMLVLRCASDGSTSYWILFAIAFLSVQFCDIALQLWLRIWTSASRSNPAYYLSRYAAIFFVGQLLNWMRWYVLYGYGNVGLVKGSVRIHEKMLNAVSSAPLSWLNSVPLGRVMNRFTQDQYQCDGHISDGLGRSIMAMLAVFSAILIISAEVPLFIGVALSFVPPFYYLSRFLRKLRADMKRLMSNAISPVISLYLEGVEAIVVNRAFGCGTQLSKLLSYAIVIERGANAVDWITYIWFRLCISLASSMLVTTTGFLLIYQDIGPAQAGFVLSFALIASNGLFYLLEMFANLEQQLVSAERINEFCEIPPEQSTSRTTIMAPEYWPSQGRIEFQDLTVRYDEDLPDILKGVSFTIEPGWRVGVVGATGAGKSTIAMSLFRAIEPRKGRILVDGIDIAAISLHDLRSALNLIVQEATLCSGSLRSALDSSDTRDDAEIFEALKKVQLLGTAQNEAEGALNQFADLDSYVAVGGGAFSAGQLQLLCMARALLKKSKVLIMDEATSSVDYETDAKITEVLKSSFAGVTMLVIAHRLATVIGFDRILVVDGGKIVEFASPRELLDREDSAFKKLCQATGEEEYRKLYEASNGRNGLNH